MELTKQAGLGIPEFLSASGQFRIVLRKWLSESMLDKMGLNARQVSAVLYAANAGRITNREYQEHCSVSKATSARELVDLVERGVLVRHGQTGKSTFYTVSPNLPMGSNVS